VKFGSANVLLQHLEFTHLQGFRSLYKDMSDSTEGKKCWKVLNAWKKCFKDLKNNSASEELCHSVWKDPAVRKEKTKEWTDKIKQYCVNEYFECLKQENHVNFYVERFKDCDIIAIQEYHENFKGIVDKLPDHFAIEFVKTAKDKIAKTGIEIKGVLLINKKKSGSADE